MMESEIDVSVSDQARALATQRKLKLVTCPICGIEVAGFGRRRYCSHRCANIASYRRKQHAIRSNLEGPDGELSAASASSPPQGKEVRLGPAAWLRGRRSPLEGVLRRASGSDTTAASALPELSGLIHTSDALPERPVAVRGIDKILALALQLLEKVCHLSVPPHTQQILLTSLAEHDVLELLPDWRTAWWHTLRSALRNGRDVDHLIGLTGDVGRTASVVGDMLQLVVAGPGTYLPSYFSQEGIAPPDLLVIPGHGAIEFLATGQERYVDTAFFYPAGEHLDALGDRFRLLQAQTRSAPLLRRHELWGPPTEVLRSSGSVQAARAWEEAITQFDEQPGNVDLVDALNETTVSALRYKAQAQPIISQGGGAATLMRSHLGFRERRCAAFQKCVETFRYRQLLPESSLERYRKTGYYSEDSWLTYLGGGRASVDEYVSHLEAIISLVLSPRGDYQLRIVDDTQNGDMRNVYWQVKHNYAVIMEAWRHDASNGEDVEYDLEIIAPTVVQGFADYFEEVWSRARYREENDVVQRLRYYVDRAKEFGVGTDS